MTLKRKSRARDRKMLAQSETISLLAKFFRFGAVKFGTTSHVDKYLPGKFLFQVFNLKMHLSHNYLKTEETLKNV
jgi:hypothetical protein